MSVIRFITTGILITIMAIGYVHQRIEIFKLGYDVQKSRRHLSHLIDQNSQLMYNLSKLESPKSLLTTLEDEDIEFANQRITRQNSYQLTRVHSGKTGKKESFIGSLLDLFTLNAEARPRH